MSKGTMLCVVLLLSSCTFLTRGQVATLRETANNLDRMAQYDEDTTKHLAEDPEANNGVIKLLISNAEQQRLSAATIRKNIGSN